MGYCPCTLMVKDEKDNCLQIPTGSRVCERLTSGGSVVCSGHNGVRQTGT